MERMPRDYNISISTYKLEWKDKETLTENLSITMSDNEIVHNKYSSNEVVFNCYHHQ